MPEKHNINEKIPSEDGKSRELDRDDVIGDITTDGYATLVKETSGVCDGVTARSVADELPHPNRGAEKLKEKTF